MRRIFIAINLPEEVKNELGEVLLSLKKDLKHAPIKWVKDNQLHITLHFLGNLTDEQTKSVAEILDAAVSKHTKARLKLGQIGFFPGKFRPRVVFVDIVELNGLRKLQSEIGLELRNLGIELDARPWHSHVTLGRINGSVNTKFFEKQNIKPLEFEVGSVDLMESELRQDGAIHTVLKTFELK